jgi:hypothetical protein
MATITLNSGTPLRFENAGVLRFRLAADDVIPLRIIKGSLQVTEGRRAAIPQMFAGALDSVVLHGDERQSQIRFRVKATGDGMLSSTGLLDRIDAAAGTSNAKTLFTTEIDLPGGPTATTGHRLTLTRCYVAEPPSLQTGDEGDELEVVIQSNDPYAGVATY